MEGEVGQERQHQVGVIAMAPVQVVRVPDLGAFQGGKQAGGLLLGEDVDRSHPAVVPVVDHLFVREHGHGTGR